MDAAEYDTNTLVLNDISSIPFRTYEPDSEQSQNFASIAIDIESRLREQGHIVYYDAGRRCIWHFRIQRADGDDDPNMEVFEQTLELLGCPLLMREEGFFEPSSLQKPRVVPQQSGHTSTSSNSSASTLDQSQRHTLKSSSQPTYTGSQEQDSSCSILLVVDAKGSQREPTPSNVIYKNFILAALLTISTTFSIRTGSIPLDYRTVLLSQVALGNDGFAHVSERGPTIGTFKIYMTTTGSLVLSMGFFICKGLLSFEEMLNRGPGGSGSQILAAPFGMIASNQLPTTFEGGTASMAQTPNTQAFSLRGAPEMHDSAWRQTCLKFLDLRGVARSKLADCLWMNLLVTKTQLRDTMSDAKSSQSPHSTVTFPWPGPLCFRKRTVEIISTNRVGDTLLSGYDECHDPLGNAQVWFSSAAEREEKICKRKIERLAVSQDVVTHDSRTSKLNGQSPLTIRRPSMAAVGSMYPTPPDALQNPNGVTPSLDGTLSSPGNPLSAATVPEVEGNYVNSAITGQFESGQDFPDSKRQRCDTILLGEPEHMFDDMGGGDMFGDNDITEADFNFFDEEPRGIGLDTAMAGMDKDIRESSLLANHDLAKVKVPITTAPKSESTHEKETVKFMKPELRHAISAQNDSRRGRETKIIPVKRESSPFDPHTVFKRVRASLGATGRASPTGSGANRVTRIFEKMNFGPTLPMINKKYEQGGQYDYSKNSSPEKPKLDWGSLPKTGYLKRHNKQLQGLRDSCLQRRLLIGSLSGLDPPNSDSDPAKVDPRLSDGEQSSVESDQDDSSSLSGHEPASPMKSSVKQVALDDDSISQVASLKELDMIEEPDHQLAAELPKLSTPANPETPLSVLFSDPEPLSLDLSLGDEDMMQIAQILTDQAATGNLHFSNSVTDDESSSIAEKNRQRLPVEARASLRLFREVISSFLPGIDFVRLKGFLDIQDVPLQGQPTRLQPRPIPGRDATAEQMRPSNLYQIPSPHLEVRRSDTKLSVLPSAVTFWESLGLAPSCGNKDISAVCVFPGWKGMSDNVKTFLGRVKSFYEVLRLGSMENMALSPDTDDGLLPYEVDCISTSPDATMTGHGSALKGVMEILRAALSNLSVSGINIVVFFVYSPSNPRTIVEACTAFQRFFDSYQKELSAKKEPVANELVLQLVSADTLSSPTCVVITPYQDLINLCMETYDRCTLFGGPMPAPAIRLEQPLPRIIDFKLIQTPSASLIRENSCIHVAYSQTVDERWVTAAWTDDWGNQQATASYCLGRKGRALSRSMDEVAHEVWESTLVLISTWKVHWRVIITKCGPMDQLEIESWIELARAEIKASVTMILMTADTNPSLQLIPPVDKLPQSSVPLSTTPVSTPQAGIVSPEQSATPATPANAANAANAAASVAAATPSGEGGADADTDAILCDVTDQTWGAVVNHRLNNSSSVIDLHPALMSGYLIKRTGTRTGDAPIAMEVNLVHTDTSPRAYEPLLREMLSYFRGLATLSRARGVVPRDMDVRPWHIAAAEKAARTLYLLM